MIRLLTAALALAMLAGAALAQKPGGNPDRQKMQQMIQQVQQERVAFEKSLNLTPQQKQKIEALNKRFRPRIEAISAKYKPQQEQMMKAMQSGKQPTPDQIKTWQGLSQKFNTELKPLMDAHKKEMDAIYTPDQRKKMAEFQQKLMQRFQQMGGPGGAPRR